MGSSNNDQKKRSQKIHLGKSSPVRPVRKTKRGKKSHAGELLSSSEKINQFNTILKMFFGKDGKGKAFEVDYLWQLNIDENHYKLVHSLVMKLGKKIFKTMKDLKSIVDIVEFKVNYNGKDAVWLKSNLGQTANELTQTIIQLIFTNAKTYSEYNEFYMNPLKTIQNNKNKYLFVMEQNASVVKIVGWYQIKIFIIH